MCRETVDCGNCGNVQDIPIDLGTGECVLLVSLPRSSILNTDVAEKKYNCYFQSSSFERDYATKTDSLPEGKNLRLRRESWALFVYQHKIGKDNQTQWKTKNGLIFRGKFRINRFCGVYLLFVKSIRYYMHILSYINFIYYLTKLQL